MPIKDKTEKSLIIQLPSLVGTKEFRPTGLMVKTLCAYLQALERGEHILPYKILEMLGASSRNWYNWLRKERFIQWWNAACDDFHANIGLSRVHNAIYRRALDTSSQDAKVYLERFDKDYKPATAKEHRFFPGIEPPEDIQGAIERSRARAKLFASEVKDTGESDPDTPPEVITPDTDIPKESTDEIIEQSPQTEGSKE